MKPSVIRFLSPAIFLTAFCGPHATFAAQAPTGPPPATVQEPRTPSAIMQPSLNALQQILDVLRPDKWKAPAAVREGTIANINSIRRDLTTTLPPLLAAADGAPDSVTRVLPAYRNIEALYDVLLRVTEAGKLCAPSQQAVALENTLASLEEGRRALGERLQSAALARDQQLHDLQAAARAVPPAPVPAPVTCPPPPRAKKRKAPPKPAQKPATTPTNSQEGAASH